MELKSIEKIIIKFYLLLIFLQTFGDTNNEMIWTSFPFHGYLTTLPKTENYYLFEF